MSARDLEQELTEDILGFVHDPLGYVRYAFPWGEKGELEKHAGPRAWQEEQLIALGEHLQDPKTRHHPFRASTVTGHGVGKSALMSMIVKWGLDTFEDTRIVVTANTDTQLRTKTWPEVGKWSRLAITSHWFRVNATSVVSLDPKHAGEWRANAVPWSETNTEAFAGLHNEGKRIILIFDEASAIADRVWEVAEGALTDADTEIIWLTYGNPTRNTGRFRECHRKFRHRWHCQQLDSREVEGTNQALFKEWEDDYGEDSDFFKVRVRGLFPKQSIRQFISEELVDKAYGKQLGKSEYDWAPVILTCDPAWTGDDELVIGMRQGLMYRTLKTMPRNDNDVWVANELARLEDEHKADAVFIDGGFGTGIVSAGRTMRRRWQLVWFSEKPMNEGALNKRAEMWDDARKWLMEGGALEADPVLRDEILSVETAPRLDGKLCLESKESMKKRGLRSPNRADAWILSFAYPVSSKGLAPMLGRETDSHDEFGFGG